MGAVVGLAGARLVSSQLHGVSALDAFSFLAVGLLTLTIVGLAVYLPARRARRTDPVRGLDAT